MKKLIQTTLTIAAIAVATLLPTSAQAGASPQTATNLYTAFVGESNAANRYTKFAEKADAEGFAQVAKLFRAASAAEAIHRDTHKAAIIKLGYPITAFQLDPVVPGSTADNLKAAIKGETFERDTMYPQYLALAKADDARSAIRAMEFAVAAEKEHARLFQSALDTLGKNAPADYYVCRECGMTLTDLPAKKCPVCRKGRDEFQKIS